MSRPVARRRRRLGRPRTSLFIHTHTWLCISGRFSSGHGPPLDLTSLLPAAGAAGGYLPEAKIFGAFYIIFTGVLHATLGALGPLGHVTRQG